MVDSNDGKVVVQNVSLILPLPENFLFSYSVRTEWETWLRIFGRFRVVSGLFDKPGQAQVNTLIYVIGT